MEKIESLNSSKFEKFEMYEVADISKIYGGLSAPLASYIILSDGTHNDSVECYGTNFYSDGGVVGCLVP